MNNDPLARWSMTIPVASAFALASAIMAGCIEAHGYGKRFKRFPKAHVIGQVRYAINQDKLLEFAETDPTFQAELHRHPEGTTWFVALVAEGIRVTLALVESSGSDPQLNLFRDKEQERQLSFFDGFGPCVYTLVYGNLDRQTGKPKFIGLHALDGQGDHLPGYIDLLENYVTATTPPPMEQQDDQAPPARREEEREGGSQNELG